jgi:hypothetical protein
MMMRKDKEFPWREVLNLTDEEFVKKVGSTMEVNLARKDLFIFLGTKYYKS